MVILHVFVDGVSLTWWYSEAWLRCVWEHFINVFSHCQLSLTASTQPCASLASATPPSLAASFVTSDDALVTSDDAVLANSIEIV